MTGVPAACVVGYVLNVWLSVLPSSAESHYVKHGHKCNDMQAMNVTRSAEFSASDVLLDSGGSGSGEQHHLLPAARDPTPEASEHASVPDALPMQPALQQADEQAADVQRGGVGSQGVVHHESEPSWHQSEGSMQEVASTSASSESGTTSCTHTLADHHYVLVRSIQPQTVLARLVGSAE